MRISWGDQHGILRGKTLEVDHFLSVLRNGKDFQTATLIFDTTNNPVVPPFVDLAPTMQHKPYNSPGPGLLGRTFSAVKMDREDVAVMKLRAMSAAQLGERRQLLRTLDQFRRAAAAGFPARLRLFLAVAHSRRCRGVAARHRGGT